MLRMRLPETIFQSTPSVGRATQTFPFQSTFISISIHALRGEGDTFEIIQFLIKAYISIHALRGEGDMAICTSGQDWDISIHALRGEGDIIRAGIMQSANGISIHALRGEGDMTKTEIEQKIAISIHALRGEGDMTKTEIEQKIAISIHALRGEGDMTKTEIEQKIAISIHALRGEGDMTKTEIEQKIAISIHALRGEGDVNLCDIVKIYHNFNPRPPWGGRLFVCLPTLQSLYFNPRPPWGGRHRRSWYRLEQDRFQSTPSVGRATAHRGFKADANAISIHALRGEGDYKKLGLIPTTLVFQSTPSVGRATV